MRTLLELYHDIFVALNKGMRMVTGVHGSERCGAYRPLMAQALNGLQFVRLNYLIDPKADLRGYSHEYERSLLFYFSV